jgi:hypothetical protein
VSFKLCYYKGAREYDLDVPVSIPCLVDTDSVYEDSAAVELAVQSALSEHESEFVDPSTLYPSNQGDYTLYMHTAVRGAIQPVVGYQDSIYMERSKLPKTYFRHYGASLSPITFAKLAVIQDGTIVDYAIKKSGANNDNGDQASLDFSCASSEANFRNASRWAAVFAKTDRSVESKCYAGTVFYLSGGSWVSDRLTANCLTFKKAEERFSDTNDYPISPASSISIRCPDSVRQGLYIIVACDTAEQKYVDFTCTLSGHTSDKTFLMQNTDKTLRLQCGSDEGASELLLEVESKGATASKTIAVIPNGGGGGNAPYDPTSRVTDISLLAFPDTVAPGGYSIMLISVNGEGDYSQRITAEISGHTSADTQYFSDGYFCNIAVGKDETADSILVTITSAQDPTVSASVSVNVDHSGDTPVDPGTDEERLQRAFWKGFAAGIPG